MERDFITKYLLPLTKSNKINTQHITKNLADDVAYINTKHFDMQNFIVTSDSVVEGRHILKGLGYNYYAEKLFFRNLSDVIVKNAIPVFYMLNIFLSSTTNQQDLALFTNVLQKLNSKFNVFLIGGDTSINVCQQPHNSCFIASMTMFAKPRDDGNFARTNKKIKSTKLFIEGKIGGAYLGFLEASFLTDTSKRKFFDKYISGVVCMKKTHKIFDKNNINSNIKSNKKSNIIASMDISDGILEDISKLFTAKQMASVCLKISDLKFETPITKAVKLCSQKTIDEINSFIYNKMQNKKQSTDKNYGQNRNQNDCFTKNDKSTNFRKDFDILQDLRTVDGSKKITQKNLKNFIQNAILFGDDYNFCYCK